MWTTALEPMDSGAPLSAKWAQSSSALGPFFLASLTTSWAVSPEGSFSTTNSWMIGNASSLMNVTSNGWFAGTVSGMPWKVKFLTEALYIVVADAGAATSAVLDAVDCATMPSAEYRA